MPVKPQPICANRRHVSDRFCLLRLVLLDSYRASSAIEVRLDGHTSFNGANGAGKTSLIRLIPLFYGESPGKIVRGGGITQSFVDHYLPRSTSYIIFEYQRRDLTCMAVLHASRTGEHVCYRFIDQPFAIGRFRDESGELVAGADLYRHIAKRGEACTEQITALSDYRAVIQNTVSKRDLRALPGRFAFVGASSRLAHIEKIATGMFARATSFVDIKRMIVSCIVEDAQGVRLESNSTTMETWVRELRAYRHIMNKQSDMDALNAADARHQVTCEALSQIHRGFISLASQLQLELAARSQELNAIAQRQAELNRKKEEQLSRCAQEAGHTEGQWRVLQKQHETLMERAAQYATEKVEELAALVERLPERQQSLRGLEKRLNLLVAEASNLTGAYKELKLSKKSQLDAAVGEEAWQMVQEEFEARRKDGETDKQVHAERSGSLKEQVKNPQASLECVAALEAADTLLGKRREAYQLAQKAHDAARQARQEADEALRVIDGELAAVRERLERERHHHAHLLQLADAAPGTLLHFLRANRPAWPQDIARVVPEDLLLRTDLAPALSDTDPLALYGVTLDLSVIDQPRVADEEALRQQIALADQAIVSTEGHLTQKSTEKGQAQKRLGDANDAARKAEVTLAQAVAQERSALTGRTAAQDAVEHSRREARQSAQAQLENAKDAIKAIEEKLAQLTAWRDGLKRAHDQTLTNDIQTIDREAERQIKDIETQIRDAEKACQSAIEAITKEELSQLEAAGVDTEAVKSLQEQIEAVRQDIQTATHGMARVSEWQLWRGADWAGKPQLENTIQERQQTLQSIEARRQRIEERHNAASQVIQTEKAGVESRRDRQHQEAGFVQTRLNRLTPWHPGLAVTPPEARNRDFLEAEMDRLLAEVQTETKRARGGVDVLKRTMHEHGGTVIGDFYERKCNELGPDREREPFAWVAPMREWFDAAHIDARRLLTGQCRTFSQGIYDFRNRLTDFNRKVASLSRDLQGSMAASIRFRAIHAIAVRLATSFDSLESCSRIKSLADEYDQWAGSDTDELPPEAFAQAVENVTRHLQGRHTIEVKLEDLLGIEIDIDELCQPRKTVKDEAQLKDASSNGLSYLILCMVFVGLINKIRRDEPVTLVWALDELRDLDIGNVHALLELLAANHIHLVSAYPDPDPDILALFQNRYTILEGRRVASFEIAEAEGAIV